jgi:hypothetical protein
MEFIGWNGKHADEQKISNPVTLVQPDTCTHRRSGVVKSGGGDLAIPCEPIT